MNAGRSVLSTKGTTLKMDVLQCCEPFRPSGYGHELTAGVSQARVLVLLKTLRIEGEHAHIKSVVAQCPPVGVEVGRGIANSGVACIA
ncbi:hypothetical protein TNCV_1553301 [Trichonephila clavipes]|nr:hypothetical protein TNCV_1553301 [Trichonephila clavipes]